MISEPQENKKIKWQNICKNRNTEVPLLRVIGIGYFCILNL